jgi:hypothetical protein
MYSALGRSGAIAGWACARSALVSLSGSAPVWAVALGALLDHRCLGVRSQLELRTKCSIDRTLEAVLFCLDSASSHHGRGR